MPFEPVDAQYADNNITLLCPVCVKADCCDKTHSECPDHGNELELGDHNFWYCWQCEALEGHADVGIWSYII